jgi:hypothetical protein
LSSLAISGIGLQAGTVCSLKHFLTEKLTNSYNFTGHLQSENNYLSALWRTTFANAEAECPN